jgi:hypothetical protein
VTDARQLASQMEHAYEHGDQRTARELALQIKALANEADDPSHASADALLARTQPDVFLLVVGLLGLGLTVWLVYNYVL